MANNSVCSFPDGRSNGATLGQTIVPCDPSAAHSACCVQGETCIGLGLCLSGTGLLYRAGCTDKTFKDGACPNICTDISGKNGGQQSTFDFIMPCAISAPQVAGAWIWKWVCGLGSDCNNSSLLFNMEPGSARQVNITGNFSPSSVTTSKPIASSTSLPTVPNISSLISSPPSASTTSNLTITPPIQPQTDCTSKVTAVGAGVGIPFALLALSALIFALWQWRKGKAQRQQFNHEMQAFHQRSHYEAAKQSLFSPHSPQARGHELDGWKARDAVFELKSTGRVNELA